MKNMKDPVRIIVDFSYCESGGSVRLNHDSIRNNPRWSQISLQEGLAVLLEDDNFEAHGTVFDREGNWFARILPETMRIIRIREKIYSKFCGNTKPSFW